MKTTWTAGLTPDQTKVVKQDYKGCSITRARLTELCSGKSETAEKEALSSNSYDNSSWAYRQADLIGYKRALAEIISLISNEAVEK